MAKFGEPWFSRRSTVPELEEHIAKNQALTERRLFFDETGEDLRLKQLGFKWSIVNEKRHAILGDFTSQFTNIFDQFYEKITGEDRKSRRKSSIAPTILPSTKTPALSRVQSRLATVPDNDSSSQPTQPSPNGHLQLSPVPEQTELEPKQNLAEQQTSGEQKPVSITQPGQITVATKVPSKRATRGGRKKAKEDSQSSDDDFVPNSRPTRQQAKIPKEPATQTRATRATKRKVATVKEDTQSSDEEFVRRRSIRRLTRQQAKSTTESKPNTRAKRARICKATTEQPLSTNKENTGAPIPMRLSSVGVDSEDIIKVMDNSLSRRVSNDNRRSICRVSLHKISVPLSTAQPEAAEHTASLEQTVSEGKALPVVSPSGHKQPETDAHSPTAQNLTSTSAGSRDGCTASSGTASQSDTEQPETVIHSPAVKDLAVQKLTYTSAGSDSTTSEGSTPPRPASSVEVRLDVVKEQILPVAQVTPRAVPPDSDVEVSLARPTPPRRKALKLRKKGGKKGTTKPKTRAAELRDEENGSTDVDVTDQDQLPAPQSDSHTPIPVPASASTESMYESCVSEIGTPPLQLSADKTPPTLVKSPPRPDSPPSPIFQKAPSVDAPLYLTGTPRTLKKLRQEYQSKTGGKMVSLSDLLNSAGRSGGSLKKASKIPRTPKNTSSLSHAKATPQKATPLNRGGTPLLNSNRQRTPVLDTDVLMQTETPGLEHPVQPLVMDTPCLDQPLAVGGKRLRSVSLERLALTVGDSKTMRRTSSTEECDRTEGESPDSLAGLDVSGSESGTESCHSNSPFLATKARTFLNGPAKKALVYTEGTNKPLSFLPRKSPKKGETINEKKAHLADKILRKKQVEERRQEDLKNRRQQELQEKIKKREERARKVAEKQAALRQIEEERKLQRLKGAQSQDSKKVTSKKAKAIEEKNKKLKERMIAAEARRKQEELQHQKRLQQLEEERKMATELAHKRREMEEEEKRLKRLEKAAQDRERHQKHMEELKEQQVEAKRKIEEEIAKREADQLKKASNEAPSKHNELVRQFERIIGGAIAKVPVLATPKIARVLVGSKSGSNSSSKPNSEKTNRLLQAYYNGSDSPCQPTPTNSTTPLSPADARLNATFTKESPASKTPRKQAPSSYQMTPAESDPLFSYENYDIGNLSSEDSTDDEEQPKKVLPMWARPESLGLMMKTQEDALNGNRVDITKIFPPEQLLKDPDLGKIFRRKRQRFYQRSSSAHWDSPLMKRNRVV